MDQQPSSSGRGGETGSTTPPRRQLQGPPHLPRLKVWKESHAIKKPRQSPVIIHYDASPKVIHASPSEFKALVQRLTCSRPPLVAKEDERRQTDDDDMLGQRFQLSKLLLSRPAAMSTAARLATFERSVRPMPKPPLGILSPPPSSLPPAAASGDFSLSPFLRAASTSGGASASGWPLPPAYCFDPFVPTPRYPLATPTIPSSLTTSTEFFSSLPDFLPLPFDGSPFSLQAEDRSCQVLKENCTHGTGSGGSTKEHGKAAQRCLAKGTGSRGFSEEILSSSSTITESSSTITDENSFNARANAGVRSCQVLTQNWTCEDGSVEKAAERYFTEPRIIDLENDDFDVKVVKRQRLVASSRFGDITPRLNCFLNIVKFIVRIKAGIRYRMPRKHYSTHGSAATDDIGKPSEGWVTKGNMCHVGQPEAWSRDVERNVSEVTNSVRRQRVGKNVGSSTFTEGEKRHCDTFHEDVKTWIDITKKYNGGLRRHTSVQQIEKAHYTFHDDVNAWIAIIEKQYNGDHHHTCMPEVGFNLVGRNNIKYMSMENILLDKNDGSNCTVICVTAGSGHGKTALLRDIYHDQRLINVFDKRIWIQMSDKLDISMLFRKIVEFTTNDYSSIENLTYLQEMVREEITDKTITLFMDDADIVDQQFFNSVLEVLNGSAKRSVVVMARTRSSFTALTGATTHSYFLSPLSEENNLKLLQKYSALGTDIWSSTELVMAAKRIISRFGANPLNLKAIGGLLCHRDGISLKKDTFEGTVMPLQLCHDALPVHLQKCLAFCCLFPEGYIFDRNYIVILWISQGFVTAAEGCELEDVAVEYFNELVCRSFFQYSPCHDFIDDKFVMHELIYNGVLSVCQDTYFKSEDILRSVPENIHHLSLVSYQFQTVQLMSTTKRLKDLQTFLVVQPEGQQYKTSVPTLNLVGLDDFFLKFTSLQTLDLNHTDIEELPGFIGLMRNLRYLSLNNTRLRTLPSEICSLSNLQTLKAKDCRFLTELPGDTKNLLKLRHLYVTKELGYVHLPYGIGHLTELRTLPAFHANGDSSHCCISELGNLRSLRGCLRLSGLESVKTSSKALEVNLKDKQYLQDVTLHWHDGGIDTDEDDDDEAENVAEQVLEALEPHSNLQELAVRGYEGTAFPAWMQGPSSLPNLVSLTLDCCCNCTQFPAIAQLPSLKLLGVRKMYDVQLLCSNVDGVVKFPSLELLNLWEMYGLEELFQASEGDCPRLRKISVSRCPDLKRLPCIPSVAELVLHFCNQLPDIPYLGSLVSLKIEGFQGVESFSLTPTALPVLKKLEIKSCNELSRVHGLEALTTVQRLKITLCPKLVLPRTSGPAS